MCESPEADPRQGLVQVVGEDHRRGRGAGLGEGAGAGTNRQVPSADALISVPRGGPGAQFEPRAHTPWKTQGGAPGTTPPVPPA